jgi:PAS domain S-box-containing protein
MKDLDNLLLRDDIPEDVKQVIQLFHSKQKKEQGQLLQERDFLGLIPEASPAAIAVLDQKAIITFINSQGVKILGIPRERIIGVDMNDPKWAFTDFDGQPLPSENLPFNIVKRTLQPVFNVEHAVLGENGVPTYLSINAAPQFDEEGVFNGVVISIEN